MARSAEAGRAPDRRDPGVRAVLLPALRSARPDVLLPLARTLGVWMAALARRREDDLEETRRFVADKSEEQQRFALDWHRANPPRRLSKGDVLAELARLPPAVVGRAVCETIRARQG